MYNQRLRIVLAGAFLVPFALLFFSGTSGFAQVADSSFIKEAAAVQPQKKVHPFQALSTADSGALAVRKADQNLVATFKKDKDFWYAAEAPNRAKSPEKHAQKGAGNSFAKNWLPTLLWIFLISAFVLILRWFVIAGRNPFLKKQRKFASGATDSVPTEHIFDIDFENEIQAAVAAENYRMAIRLHFLFLLKQLDEKGLISYRSERTNSDYLQQLRASVYYNDFFSLTRSFEYAWYGKFELSKQAFESIEARFNLFTKGVVK